MKVKDLRVNHVYRGPFSKATRLVLDLSGQEVIYVGNDGHRHVMNKKSFASWALEDTLSWLMIWRDGFLKPCPYCGSLGGHLSDYQEAVVCFKCGFTGPNILYRDDGSKKRRISRKQQIHWWNSIPRKGFYGTV